MSAGGVRYVRACAERDVPEGTGLGLTLAGREVAVFRVDGGLSAVEDVCTHAGERVSEGPLAGACVTCPWHGARFDVRTGEPRGGPAFTPLEVFPVRVEGGEVLVGLPGEP